MGELSVSQASEQQQSTLRARIFFRLVIGEKDSAGIPNKRVSEKMRPKQFSYVNGISYAPK